MFNYTHVPQPIMLFTKFKETGIDLPIIQFNPVGDVIESFKLFVKTFSEER
mgnify:CR=1 FL=1